MAPPISTLKPVFLLAFSAFVFNTTEFVPVGLLSAIGSSFNMSSLETGPMLTFYASVVALTSLPAVLVFSKFERSRLLLGLMAVFVAGHCVTVLAPTYPILMAGRVCIALAHALFWAITPAMVVRLAPLGFEGKALSLLSTGSVLAFVLGVPVGRMIGQVLGWRITFAIIAVVTVCLMVGLWRGLPKLAASRGGSWRDLPLLASNKPLLWLYVLTVMMVTAQFSAYTYLEPLLEQHFGYAPSLVTVLLLLFGGSGILGSMVFSRYQELHHQRLLTLSIAIMGCSLALLPVAAVNPWWLGLLCIVWGTGMMLLALSLQSKCLKLSPDATDIAMAIYSSLFNVGIGSGALLGNALATRFSVVNNGPLAALLIVASIVPLVCLIKSRRKDSAVSA